MEDLNYDELVREVAGLPEECEAQCGTEEQNEVEEDVYTIEEQLRVLAISRSILEKHSALPANLGQAFYNCQRGLRLEKQSRMTQTTILDDFGKN